MKPGRGSVISSDAALTCAMLCKKHTSNGEWNKLTQNVELAALCSSLVSDIARYARVNYYVLPKTILVWIQALYYRYAVSIVDIGRDDAQARTQSRQWEGFTRELIELVMLT